MKRLDRGRLNQFLSLAKLLVELRCNLLALYRSGGWFSLEGVDKLAALVEATGASQVTSHLLGDSFADAESETVRLLILLE